MPERLNRFLARRGISSRRGADDLIAKGLVRVDGMVAVTGSSVDPDTQTVEVNGDRVKPEVALVTMILNKPPDVVTTRRDPQHRRTVMHLVPATPGLVPVGRLDTDSRGLLVMSNDGELVHRLSHPKYEVPKTYRVRLERWEDRLLGAVRSGVHLEDGFAKPLSAALVDADLCLLEVVMGEGRKREVRRIFSALGVEVFDLQRTRLGPLELGSLKEGKHRLLNLTELASLYHCVQLDPPVS